MAVSSSEVVSSSEALIAGRVPFTTGVGICMLASAVPMDEGPMTYRAERRHGLSVVLAIAAAATVSACGPVKRPDGGTGLLPVGAVAPDFEGHDATGKTVRLSEQHGHSAVVYFYPKDGTPGCTTEACAFRDAFKRYDQRGIVI